MSEALTKPLPCPFCGADDGLTMTDGSTYRWGYAYCSNCGASAGETRRAYPDDGKWHEEAIRQWNQRAAPTPRKPLTDEEIDQVTDQQWAQHDHKPIYAAHRAYARAVIAAYEAKQGEQQ